MQLTLTLVGSRDFVLPIEYNYLVQAAIYRMIEQPALRSYLHEEGFAIGQRKFKLFVFSRLLGQSRFDQKIKKIVFSSQTSLVICSPINFIIQEIGNGLLRQGYVRLGDNIAKVSKVDIADPVVHSNVIEIRMLSPLVVYSTIEEESRRFTYYYSPYEERFKELVFNNLAKKYLIVYGRAIDCKRFDIVPIKVGRSEFKIVKYKGTVIKGWMGSFRLEGDPQLLEVALHAGLGAKNSQGFGCCKLERIGA